MDRNTHATTIEGVVRRGLCNGCGTCVGLCPHAAVAMNKDSAHGIYIPVTDRDVCRECGICFAVCPGHSVDFSGLNQAIFGKNPLKNGFGAIIHCYVGYAVDPTVRYAASSGGIVTTLLSHALASGDAGGVLMTRMSRDNPLEPEPFIGTTVEDVTCSSGSKYCPVPANTALREILAGDGPYIAVGLPCHIHGIRKAEQRNAALREKLYLRIGLFCGMTKTFLGTEYMLRRLAIDGRDIKALRYRGGGYPGGLQCTLANGDEISVPLREYYDINFCSFVTPRCTMCIDETAELSDISVGDAWLPDITGTDTSGSSLIVTRTPRGEAYIRDLHAKNIIRIVQVSPEKVVQSQSGMQRKRNFGFWSAVFGVLGYGIPRYGGFTDVGGLPPAALLVNTVEFGKMMLASHRSTWGLLTAGCSLIRRIGSRNRGREPL